MESIREIRALVDMLHATTSSSQVAQHEPQWRLTFNTPLAGMVKAIVFRFCAGTPPLTFP
jgi:hypothetical protein